MPVVHLGVDFVRRPFVGENGFDVDVHRPVGTQTYPTLRRISGYSRYRQNCFVGCNRVTARYGTYYGLMVLGEVIGRESAILNFHKKYAVGLFQDPDSECYYL